jgi:prolyl-tRNA editing enzyme YbaK/EbsC (Cys-tRNA(Pro) deacylase)
MELLLKDEVVLVMLGGNAKIDYQKFKAQFKTKAKMLNVDEVVEWTSHPVGGVCPFGLLRRSNAVVLVATKHPSDFRTPNGL